MDIMKYKTMYGNIRITRKINNNEFVYNVTINYKQKICGNDGDITKSKFHYYTNNGTVSDNWENKFPIICSLLERNDTNAETINKVLSKR